MACLPYSKWSRIHNILQRSCHNIAGSNGSVDPDNGKQVCIYPAHHNGTKYSESQTYNASRNATSYRSKLEGIFGTIEATNEANIMETDKIYDNNTAVAIVNRKLTANNMLVPEAKIVLACHKRKRKNICSINLRWMNRYQNKGNEYEVISQNTRLNVDLDHRSEDSQICKPPTPMTPYPGSGVIFIIKGEHIATNYKACTKTAIMKAIHREYFPEKCRKYRSTAKLYNAIYWKGIGRTLKTLTIAKNTQLTNIMNGWLSM